VKGAGRGWAWRRFRTEPLQLSRRFKQGELAAREQLAEVAIEAHQVLTKLDYSRRCPGIRHIVARELLVETELPQPGPFRAQGGKLHAR